MGLVPCTHGLNPTLLGVSSFSSAQYGHCVDSSLGGQYTFPLHEVESYLGISESLVRNCASSLPTEIWLPDSVVGSVSASVESKDSGRSSE